MTIGILHISDIHVRASGNFILARIRSVADAFLSRLSPGDLPLIALTGDLAFSGRDDEYKVARDFLRELTSEIAKARKLDPGSIPLVMVPGNHDCNFGTEKDIRKRLLENLVPQLAKQEMQDASIADELTSVQSSFFQLMDETCPTRRFRDQYSKLAWGFKLNVGGTEVTAFCYNTAWVSQKKEHQGQLLFPVEAIPPDDTEAPLVISLFHHPYNWQEATVSRIFRQRVEETADIILTGHEHESDVRSHQNRRNETTHYVEGDVLQDSSPNKSGFNVILVNLPDQTWKVIPFDWTSKDELYVPTEESPWNPLGRSKRSRRQFINTSDFAEYLSDPGATFTHPRARRLRQNDLFVYPDVDVNNPADRAASDVLSGNDLPSFVLKEQRCFFVGSSRSGKTALSKTLYGDLRAAGRVPLLLSGSNLRLRDIKDPSTLLRVAFGRQYGPESFEKFFQLHPEARGVIVDDFHRAPINEEARANFLRYLANMFGIVILFVDEEFALDTAINGANLELFAAEFRVCRLREFGHLKREQMIRRWCNLGDAVSEEDDRAYRVAEIQKDNQHCSRTELLPKVVDR